MDTIHEMTADAALMPRFDDGMVNILDYRLYPNTSHIHPHMCG